MWAQTGSPKLEAEAQSENEEPITAVTAVRDSTFHGTCPGVGSVDYIPVSPFVSFCYN